MIREKGSEKKNKETDRTQQNKKKKEKENWK